MADSRGRVALLLTLTFAAGAAAGAAADRLGVLPGAARAGEVREGPERHVHGPGRTTIERFADELGLTEDQRGEIETILERHRASMREIWHEVRPRYRALVDSVRTEIEAVLTPEQVREYRALLEAKRDRERARERDREGGDDRDATDDTGASGEREESGG